MPGTGPGAPCWIELAVPDTQAAAVFYARLFGWQAQPPPSDEDGYVVLTHHDEPVAGCVRGSRSAGTGAWTVHLRAPDIEECVTRVTAAGGQVLAGPSRVGSLGHQAFLVDPVGAALAAWQPLELSGLPVRRAVGLPSWFETLTDDYERSIAFYREAFDWDVHTLSDTAELRYSTLGDGQEAVAGIEDAQDTLEGAASQWLLYVDVADTDASAAEALAAGGRLAAAAQDTPFGRLAVLEDPAGARFAVMGPAPT